MRGFTAMVVAALVGCGAGGSGSRMHGQPVAGMGAEDAGDGTPDGCGLTFDGTEYACACDGEPATVCHVEGDFNGPDGRASLFGPTACKAPNAVISCTETTTPCAFCDPQKSVW